MVADYLPQWSGEHAFTLTTTGRARVWLAGNLAVDAWDAGSGAGAATTTPGGRPVHGATVALKVGEPVPIVIELAPTDEDVRWGRHSVDLRCRPPVPEDLLARAVASAVEADVALVVVGLDADWETEGRDRGTMALPPAQEALVDAVVAANPRTVVVLNAGSPLALPFADRVPALVQLYYGGQEAGNALADVLFGDVNPSGRLPTTVPMRIEDTPSFLDYPGERGQVFYGEGIFVGHRWYEARGIAPRFPFGHGLSYTTFEYGPAEARVDGDEVRVALDVTNRGARAGAEVVQLYVRDVEATVARPLKELKGFARVLLQPGEARRVELRLRERDLAFWDPSVKAFVTEPGDFEMLLGASSADIRATTTFTWRT
jgi:beta-glucosidase